MEVRRLATEADDLAPLDEEHLLAGLRRLQEGTGMGTDSWEATVLKKLPGPARAGLLAFFHLLEEEIYLPSQWLADRASLAACLGCCSH